jgi:hypothetical protein
MIDLVFWLKEFSVVPRPFAIILWRASVLPTYLKHIRNSLQKPIGVGAIGGFLSQKHVEI